MTVVVKHSFSYQARSYKKGDVIFDSDAKIILAHPVRRRNVTPPVGDETVFAHFRPEGWKPGEREAAPAVVATPLKQEPVPPGTVAQLQRPIPDKT